MRNNGIIGTMPVNNFQELSYSEIALTKGCEGKADGNFPEAINTGQFHAHPPKGGYD